jgi:hypothetical protein
MQPKNAGNSVEIGQGFGLPSAANEGIRLTNPITRQLFHLLDDRDSLCDTRPPAEHFRLRDGCQQPDDAGLGRVLIDAGARFQGKR